MYLENKCKSGEIMLTIKEFLNNIKLEDSTKEYLGEIWREIENYLSRLSSYSEEAQNEFLEDYLIKEIVNSSNLESESYSKDVIRLYEEGVFSNNKINDEVLKTLNKTIRINDRILEFDEFEDIRREKNKDITYEEYVENEKSNLAGNYRQEDVFIGGKEGIEYAVHIPPKPEEIPAHINDFINYYNSDSSDDLSDPIVKAALIHVIFIKIHPFANGNGREARILLNNYMHHGINKKYNLDLKYLPLNLSKSFDLSRMAYFTKQNNIIFKEGIDNNEPINAWIKYVLIAIEEQLYYINSRLDEYDEFLSSVKSK